MLTTCRVPAACENRLEIVRGVSGSRGARWEGGIQALAEEAPGSLGDLLVAWRGVGAVRGPRRAKNGDHVVRPGKEAAAVGRRRVLEHGAVPGRLPLFQKGRWQR